MKNEKIQLRVKILCEMDNYILDVIGDERIFELQFMCGVPDGATMNDILEIVKDNELWLDCINCFANCCKLAGAI